MTPMEIGPVAAVSPSPDVTAVSWTPDAGIDNGPEAARVQSVARPPLPASEAPKAASDALSPRASSHDLAEFALPAAQLSPATLIGLQVEAAHGWPLFHPGGAPAPQARARDDAAAERERRRRPAPEAQDGAEPAAEAPAAAPPPAARDGAAPAILEASDADWCATLTLALREALAARVPPQALLAAAQQWERGRCVVLACPQGADPEGPAWAFVLWPGRATPGALALRGLRVEARLHWWTPPHDGLWRHVRVVKEHHPRRGRQLVACDAASGDAAAHVACAVQLGPVLARSVHGCDVSLRIDAVQRFWTALGAQWSVHVVVSALPLAGVRDVPMEILS